MMLEDELKKKQALILGILNDYLPSNPSAENGMVIDAMRYSLFAGGKRIRPLFMQAAFEACGGKGNALNAFMAAIEMIHTYSLIHDDLPAMDNDDLRRGLPTCHVVYGENIAILAGDALLNKAFEIIIEEAVNNWESSVLLAMKELGTAAGFNGMIGGQVADVLSENKEVDLNLLNYIHLHKTSALIEAAFVIGALLAGGIEGEVERFRQIGKCIGLAFQIQDDLLDVLGTAQELGKPLGSDEKNSKATYVTLLGIEASKQIVDEKFSLAIALLEEFPASEFLVNYLNTLKTRRN
ncbi:MAG: polyprenyl synthetase family protein [Vallitaleaceae bacterium]|nr:polyprenyl synthetase family protein [Vallitaleaceae bacterium]